jgi:hypothetical protein
MSAEEIAAKLTKAQRELLALVCDEKCVGSEDERIQPFCDDEEPTDTINQCFKAGLMVELGCGDLDDFRVVPLPLGLAVRAILTGETNDQQA